MTPVTVEGRVFGVERPSDLPGTVVVSVEVAEVAAAQVAQAAASGRVSLVLLPPVAVGQAGGAG